MFNLIVRIVRLRLPWMNVLLEIHKIFNWQTRTRTFLLDFEFGHFGRFACMLVLVLKQLTDNMQLIKWSSESFDSLYLCIYRQSQPSTVSLAPYNSFIQSFPIKMVFHFYISSLILAADPSVQIKMNKVILLFRSKIWLKGLALTQVDGLCFAVIFE